VLIYFQLKQPAILSVKVKGISDALKFEG